MTVPTPDTIQQRIDRLANQIRHWTAVMQSHPVGSHDANAAKRLVRLLRRERDALVGGKRWTGPSE